MPSTRRLALAALAALAGCSGGSEASPSREGPAASSSGDDRAALAPPASEPEPVTEPVTEREAEPLPLDPASPPPIAPPPPDGPELARAREQFAEGVRAYQANDFGRAAALLVSVDQTIPTPELAYNIAYCYQRMADPERAIRYFQRYLETGHPGARERADVEARIAQMQALAARQRDMTMTLPPTMDAMTADAAALFRSGQEMFRRRRYPAALQAFSAAAAAFQALGVEVPELVYNLAVTSERTGSLDDAADYYEEYLRQRPNDPEAERLRAHVERLRRRRR